MSAEKNKGVSGEFLPETLYPHVRFSFEVTKILHQEKSDLQDLVLFENPTFGRVLMLDGVTQVTLADEFIYHEMMSHVPILAHGDAKEVLVIGGGDGGVAREVLRHPGVERCTMVEIDAAVVTFSKQYMPEVSDGVFENPRLDLIIDDGVKFVAETDRKFDVISVDSTDPEGPGAVLFTEEFYAACKRCLNPGGVLVTQNGVPFMQSDELVSSLTKFKKLFGDSYCYMATIPTYVSGAMAMGWASDNADLRKVSLETLQGRYEAAGLDTKYYTPELHKGAFALPAYVKKLVP